jgi:2-methylcitrate dehydratase PrpD
VGDWRTRPAATFVDDGRRLPERRVNWSSGHRRWRRVGMPLPAGEFRLCLPRVFPPRRCAAIFDPYLDAATIGHGCA